ncbi:hypothetical protein GCM10009872_15360 [Actinopolymorpha rutila]
MAVEVERAHDRPETGATGGFWLASEELIAHPRSEWCRAYRRPISKEIPPPKLSAYQRSGEHEASSQIVEVLSGCDVTGRKLSSTATAAWSGQLAVALIRRGMECVASAPVT